MKIYEPIAFTTLLSSPSACKPPLPGSQAQKRLLRWVGALGNLEGKRSNGAASHLLPSSDRPHSPEGFLIPSPHGCGVTERTKGCYLKLRSLGGVGALGIRRMSALWQVGRQPLIAIQEKVCIDLHMGSKPLTSLTWLRSRELGSWKEPERSSIPGASFKDEINTQWSGQLPVMAVYLSFPTSDAKM